MTRKRTILAGGLTALLLSLVLPRAGAADAPAAAAKAAAIDPIVAPYVGPATMLVVKVDIASLDAPAAAKWFDDNVKAKLPENVRNEMAGDAKEGLAQATQWLADFKKAGGTSGYLVVSAAGAQQPAVAGIIPLADGADATTLGNLFTTGKAAGGEPNPEIQPQVVGKVLLVGPPGNAQKLQQLGGGERPDLAAALASGGTSPAVVAFSPPPALRMVASAMIGQTLPPQLGGGPLMPIVNGFRWISLSAALPPQGSATLKVQAVNATAADAIAKVLAAAIDTGRKSFAQDQTAPDLTAIAAALAPKVDGDAVTISIDPKTMDETVAPLFVSAMIRARAAASMVASASNERQILMATIMYANENHGQLPPDLASLDKFLTADAANKNKVFQNPRSPKSDVGYVYINYGKKMTDLKEPSGVVMLYEKLDTPAEKMNLGYADGHVEAKPWDDAKAEIDKSKTTNAAVGESSDLGAK